MGDIYRYEDYINSPQWKAKADLFKRSVKTCPLCGDRVTPAQLDVHHNTYERLGREELADLFCLCRWCHAFFEFTRSERGRRLRFGVAPLVAEYDRLYAKVTDFGEFFEGTIEEIKQQLAFLWDRIRMLLDAAELVREHRGGEWEERRAA